jgi:hypothetical protein
VIVVTRRKVNRKRARWQKYDPLIPESVILEVMGEAFGRKFLSFDETVEFLNNTPGAREWLETCDPGDKWESRRIN